MDMLSGYTSCDIAYCSALYHSMWLCHFIEPTRIRKMQVSAALSLVDWLADTLHEGACYDKGLARLVSLPAHASAYALHVCICVCGGGAVPGLLCSTSQVVFPASPFLSPSFTRCDAGHVCVL